MLILGGSAAVTDLTGINTIAACFLIPISVCTYVFVGGIRSALFCDYVHTMVLFVFILVFMFTAFTTSDKIGSPTRMWELLQEAAARSPVPNNAEGSYLTMRSVSGLIFGVVNVIGNFSTVFLVRINNSEKSKWAFADTSCRTNPTGSERSLRNPPQQSRPSH
jgi:Na+/proline symporter